jgi:DNA-binding transcriptional ArsR family regulator
VDDLEEIAMLESRAGEAATLLRLMANEKRLLILCRLALEGEMPVTALANVVGLSQSALSQHLAKMREEGLVATRRNAQMLFYRIADLRAERLLMSLKDIFCPEFRKR